MPPGLQGIAAQHGGKIAFKTCNIRSEEDIDDLFDHAVTAYGRVDVLVNNGGGQFYSAASSISAKGWAAVVETNLTGTFLCSKAVHAAWMGENGGCIINIICDMWKGFPGMAHTGVGTRSNRSR